MNEQSTVMPETKPYISNIVSINPFWDTNHKNRQQYLDASLSTKYLQYVYYYLSQIHDVITKIN